MYILYLVHEGLNLQTPYLALEVSLAVRTTQAAGTQKNCFASYFLENCLIFEIETKQL